MPNYLDPHENQNKGEAHFATPVFLEEDEIVAEKLYDDREPLGSSFPLLFFFLFLFRRSSPEEEALASDEEDGTMSYFGGRLSALSSSSLSSSSSSCCSTSGRLYLATASFMTERRRGGSIGVPGESLRRLAVYVSREERGRLGGSALEKLQTRWKINSQVKGQRSELNEIFPDQKGSSRVLKKLSRNRWDVFRMILVRKDIVTTDVLKPLKLRAFSLG
ncbi:regulatory particle non-ATPase 13 [Striga asiatica]|uniref:Regulatory particle non-ATPase 13 n=1 Tax=Striga asiatica TaxID=4170 RepID=A0A5A7RHR6_STRAF|nr:regulatory particle non-ATPase 13 [Striga asiatica]